MTKIAELQIKRDPDRIVVVVPFGAISSVSAGMSLWRFVAEGMEAQLAVGFRQHGLTDDYAPETEGHAYQADDDGPYNCPTCNGKVRRIE